MGCVHTAQADKSPFIQESFVRRLRRLGRLGRVVISSVWRACAAFVGFARGVQPAAISQLSTLGAFPDTGKPPAGHSERPPLIGSRYGLRHWPLARFPEDSDYRAKNLLRGRYGVSREYRAAGRRCRGVTLWGKAVGWTRFFAQ